MMVADIGSGTGYFAIPFARAIGPTGRVLAVDLRPELPEMLPGKLAKHDVPANIVTLQMARFYSPMTFTMTRLGRWPSNSA